MASPRRIATLWQAVQFNPRHGAELLLCFIIRLMKEIDEVIDKQGGWPGAFVGASQAKH